jgi:hypothetical protein
VIADAFGYFAPSTAGVPTMVSAAVTGTSIAITYNEPVTCPTTVTASAPFTYDWTGTLSGITSVSGCTTSGDVLTLAGSFTLPSGTGGSITYTAPTTNSAVLSVWATGTSPAVYAATQTIAVSAYAAPTMVSAYATATTLVITYNEDVTCPSTQAGVDAAFAYDYNGVASGLVTGTGTGLTCSGTGTTTLTLAENGTGTITAPSSSASITYTAPPDQTSAPANSAALSVSATGTTTPVLYAATQRLSGSMWTTPTIESAVVTPGAYGTGAIAVTYNEDVTCPAGTAVQTRFAYSNGGATAYPSACAGTAALTLTLSNFYSTTTGSTVALEATLLAPVATDTLVYTAPTTDSTTASVYASADFPTYPATQTFPMLLGVVPTMESAIVNATTIAITYNVAVSCPTTLAEVRADFAYDYIGTTSGIGAGLITSCATAGDVLTLTATSGFVAPTGTAQIVYTQGATAAASVYSTANPLVFEVTETLPASDIS